MLFVKNEEKKSFTIFEDIKNPPKKKKKKNPPRVTSKGKETFI